MIEGLGAELNADGGAAREIDRSRKAFGLKPGLFQECDDTVNGIRRHNQVYVLRHHGLFSPVVDRHTADNAPRNIGALQNIDEAHDIVRPPEVCQS
jgi:hypothetical protein